MVPARAGMSPNTVLEALSSVSGPRASGDEPHETKSIEGTSGVVPARAGMSPMAGDWEISEYSGPRASGDEPRDKLNKAGADAWSPRERG